MASLDPTISAALNAVLKHVLTAINQYFLHARMLKHMGQVSLADDKYRESIDAMRQADKLVEHLLAQGGAPHMQDLGALTIGNSADTIMAADRALEEATRLQLTEALSVCRAQNDTASAALMEKLLASVNERMKRSAA